MANSGFLLTELRIWGSYDSVIIKRHFQCFDPAYRALALACVMLVFALGLFSASPELHEKLHPLGDQNSEDGCAVVFFASGVALLLAAVAVPPQIVEWREARCVESVEIFLDSPRYLLRPERGPPVA